MADPLEPHYRIVLRTLAEGRVIPLLGAGVNRCGRPPDAGWGTGTYLPDGGELSRYLASCAAFDPEGRMIVTASDDGTARVWSAKTGRSLTVMRGHEGFVTRAAFNPLAGSWRPSARTATSGSGRSTSPVEATLRHGGEVSTAVFDRSGRLVVTAASDGLARIFDWRTGEERPPIRESDDVRTADVSADGRLIVTATGFPDGGGPRRGANVWDAASRRLVGPLEGGHTKSVASAAFSPDGSRIDGSRPRRWTARACGTSPRTAGETSAATTTWCPAPR